MAFAREDGGHRIIFRENLTDEVICFGANGLNFPKSKCQTLHFVFEWQAITPFVSRQIG